MATITLTADGATDPTFVWRAGSQVFDWHDDPEKSERRARDDFAAAWAVASHALVGRVLDAPESLAKNVGRTETDPFLAAHIKDGIGDNIYQWEVRQPLLDALATIKAPPAAPPTDEEVARIILAIALTAEGAETLSGPFEKVSLELRMRSNRSEWASPGDLAQPLEIKISSGPILFGSTLPWVDPGGHIRDLQAMRMVMAHGVALAAQGDKGHSLGCVRDRHEDIVSGGAPRGYAKIVMPQSSTLRLTHIEALRRHADGPMRRFEEIFRRAGVDDLAEAAARAVARTR